MTQSRQSLTDTPYYHCILRCVRRVYLCDAENTHKLMGASLLFFGCLN